MSLNGVEGQPPDSARSSLGMPLLQGRERMVLLQEQVISLERKLHEMERKMLQIESARPSFDTESQGAPLESARALPKLSRMEPPAATIQEEHQEHQERQEHTLENSAKGRLTVQTAKTWKSAHFAGEDEDGRIERLDEELFIAVLQKLFNYVVPDWHKASINPDGSLDLHGGAAARVVPFFAIVLAVPTYMLLPIFGVWFALHHKHLQARSRFVGLARTLGLSWCAWVIFLYTFLGNPLEDVRERQQTTILTLGFPFWSLAWFGYDLANKRLTRSCDRAVEKMKLKVRQDANYVNARTGGFVAVLKALADPEDGTSLYPMFAAADEDQIPNSLPKPYTFSCAALVAVQVLYALTPCLEKPCGFWPTVTNITAAFAIGYAAYGFCHNLVVKLVEFKDCVDEVRTFIYLMSPEEVRRIRAKQQNFLILNEENCKFRKLLAKQSDSISRPPDGWISQMQEYRKYINGCVEGRPEDLPLEVRRCEVDLSTVSGVKLFRHLHSWLSADVINERFGIDTSASILVVIMLFLMGIGTAPLIFSKHMDMAHVNLTQTVALVDIVMSLIYILLACNHCVDMNDLLFHTMDQVLLQWKDHASAEEKDIGTVWTGIPPENYTCLKPGKADTCSSPVEVRAAIDITRERLVMQAPQRILGFKVTKTLRAKLVSTMGTGIAAIAVPLIKKHFEH